MAFGLSAVRDPKKRLLLKLLLVALVHIAMIFLGNENATPEKLLASFAISTGLIILSDRARAKLSAPLPARPLSSTTTTMTTTSTAVPTSVPTPSTTSTP